MATTDSHATATTADGHGDQPPVLGHHFDDIEQQRSTMRLGMWMFLVTELMFFGGVFVAYTAYRLWYPAAWHAGGTHLNVWIAFINSVLLLTGSLTITMAIHYAQLGRQNALVWCLALTCLMGIAFLGFKTAEYTQDYFEGLIPGAHFNAEMFDGSGASIEHVQLFFSFYYCMTAIHVVHLIIGISLVAWLFLEARRGEITPDRFVKVEMISLYWHFVDLIWLFIVPLLYLAGPHTIDQLPFMGGGHGG